jgi:hypothetical protein
MISVDFVAGGRSSPKNAKRVHKSIAECNKGLTNMEQHWECNVPRDGAAGEHGISRHWRSANKQINSPEEIMHKGEPRNQISHAPVKDFMLQLDIVQLRSFELPYKNQGRQGGSLKRGRRKKRLRRYSH